MSRLHPLILHFALVQTGAFLAGGFIGAFFLKSGFSLSAALAAYAAYLALRFVLRFASLAMIRRLGYGRAFMLGAVIMGLQFLPLQYAAHPLGLALWMLCIALGESLYCPLYHATMAVGGSSETRGRQLGLQTSLGTLISVAAPLAGAALLTRFGPAATFSLATFLTLLAVVPLGFLGTIEAGPVPTLRQSLADTDRISMLAFAGDGWLSAGLIFAWPMVLFASLGSQYGALGLTNAAAGLVGAVASMVCGHGIDRGHRLHYLNIVCLLLAASMVLRAAAAWSPWAAVTANLTGAAIFALYVPILMSAIYDRAQRSGAAYRFHFAAEAGWDAGAAAGCLVTALVAALCPSAPSLAMLPAIAGIALVYACLRADHHRLPNANIFLGSLRWR